MYLFPWNTRKHTTPFLSGMPFFCQTRADGVYQIRHINSSEVLPSSSERDRERGTSKDFITYSSESSFRAVAR